jgi:deoxyribodipyrimidine photo-lyase
MKIAIFWFRRDLRLEDNSALLAALKSGCQVLPIFIFDQNILSDLPRQDARLSFIYDLLTDINKSLHEFESGVKCLYGSPLDVWKFLIRTFDVSSVFINKDYEPYARKRDQEITTLLSENGIPLYTFKDQVVFEENEILKADGNPYTIFTPYKNKWLSLFNSEIFNNETPNFKALYKQTQTLPPLSSMNFKVATIKVKPYNLSSLNEYSKSRDFPSTDNTSYLSPHLRFGSVSVRKIISTLNESDNIFLSELIWREFFMQIIYHFPKVITENFKVKYDSIIWRNNQEEFEKWCVGKTGYPMVDAGMRQLNATGYMHNRVRMVTASFLCKHLLIDWRWGEAYFAEKLLDYELSSNNGNWQWSAGTGCDATPYFRVFNPTSQQQKFDKKGMYVEKWIPELDSLDYVSPIVDHKLARDRALNTYKNGLEAH